MAEAGSWYEDWSTPALLRHARNLYRFAIRDALDEAGYDDMPRDGAYVVGAVANTGDPLTGLIRHMGVSKQALVGSWSTRSSYGAISTVR